MFMPAVKNSKPMGLAEVGSYQIPIIKNLRLCTLKKSANFQYVDFILAHLCEQYILFKGEKLPRAMYGNLPGDDEEFC